jgi:hypothetical protein
MGVTMAVLYLILFALIFELLIHTQLTFPLISCF